MSEFEMMSKRLGETGLYDITEGKGVYAELMAYAAGLDLYFDELENLRREVFIDEADEKGLEMYERLISVCNVDNSLEGRRRSVMSALSITGKDFTLDGIRKILGIYNIEGEITENDRYIIINCMNELSESEEKAINEDIQRFAPLHTEICVFSTGAA